MDPKDAASFKNGWYRDYQIPTLKVCWPNYQTNLVKHIFRQISIRSSWQGTHQSRQFHLSPRPPPPQSPPPPPWKIICNRGINNADKLNWKTLPLLKWERTPWKVRVQLSEDLPQVLCSDVSVAVLNVEIKYPPLFLNQNQLWGSFGDVVLHQSCSYRLELTICNYSVCWVYVRMEGPCRTSWTPPSVQAWMCLRLHQWETYEGRCTEGRYLQNNILKRWMQHNFGRELALLANIQVCD